MDEPIYLGSGISEMGTLTMYETSYDKLES